MSYQRNARDGVMPSIQRLCLQLDPPGDTQVLVADSQWGCFFIRLLSLQHLWLDTPCHGHLWAILDVRTFNDFNYTSMQYQGYLCKYLSSITIIVDGNDLTSSSRKRSYHESFKTSLFRFLEVRRNSGFPLRLLQLRYRHAKPLSDASQLEYSDVALLELESWRPELENYVD